MNSKFLKEAAEVHCRTTDWLKKWYSFEINQNQYFWVTLNKKNFVYHDFWWAKIRKKKPSLKINYTKKIVSSKIGRKSKGIDMRKG
jgi:hypothetical protein